MSRPGVFARQLCKIPEPAVHAPRQLRRLTRLPSNFGSLCSLQTFHSHWSVTSLPDSFTNLRSLRTLGFGARSATRHPPNFTNLSGMQEVRLECSSLQTLPRNFGNLQNLQTLRLVRCHNLRHLPASLGGLSSLHNFAHVESGVVNLSDSFSSIQTLQVLTLACRLSNHLPHLQSRAPAAPFPEHRRSTKATKRLEYLEMSAHAAFAIL